MKAFAEKLNGRWYCDGDDQELRLARFERQSPVEWYTGMPADRDAPLSHASGHVTLAHEPSGLAASRSWLAALARDACVWLPSPPPARRTSAPTPSPDRTTPSGRPTTAQSSMAST